MSAALTATVDTASTPPRVLLDVTGMAGATVTITRTDPAGNTVTVREADGAALVAGAFTVYDYEAQYQVANTWTATSDTADSASDTATLAVTQPWLIHPGVPSLSRAVQVAQRGDRTRDTSTGVHTILGRADPIAVSDGARKSATFPLTLATSTLTEEADLTALLADASPLLLQIGYSGVDRAEYCWVSIGQVVQSDAVDWFGNEHSHWTLPCTVVAAPTGSQQAERTYADMLADFATYADTDAAYATYHDLLVDARI